MKLQKCQGIILKKSVFQEADVHLEVLCKELYDQKYTRKKFVVHGILKSKRRNPIVVELGNLVQIDYYEKDINETQNVKEIQLIERFWEFKSQYQNFELLGKILEITYYASMSDQRELKEIYVLLLKGLEFLQSYVLKEKEDVKKIIEELSLDFSSIFLLFFSVRVLMFMGYVGDLVHCSFCHDPLDGLAKWQEKLYFYCRKCDATANVIDYYYSFFLQQIKQKKFSNFIKFLKQLHIQKSIDRIDELLWELQKRIEIHLKEIIPMKRSLFI
ncbi:MAG: recombination protein O N-terminal domain-containing protein [Leptospiraceae bacterium]|nr:recombination protein O N-terminal domain-containing protein [Leptospiraceae bacterium]MDW7976987.1 recombination protein O N-terminal domain-containing protein [Leptospiraceae bacterium]